MIKGSGSSASTKRKGSSAGGNNHKKSSETKRPRTDDANFDLNNNNNNAAPITDEIPADLHPELYNSPALIAAVNVKPFETSYLPQLKDHVYYFRQGHDPHPMIGIGQTISLKNPFEKNDDFPHTVECIISKINYVMRDRRTVAQLTMTPVKNSALNTKFGSNAVREPFEIEFIETNTTDYLVLKHRYDAAVELVKGMKVGGSVEVMFMDAFGKPYWDKGKIIDLGSPSDDPKFQDSLWEWVNVQWESEVSRVCPWEIRDIENYYKKISAKEPKVDATLRKTIMNKLKTVTDIPYPPATRPYPLLVVTVVARLKSNFYRHPEAIESDLKWIRDNLASVSSTPGVKKFQELVKEISALIDAEVRKAQPQQQLTPTASRAPSPSVVTPSPPSEQKSALTVHAKATPSPPSKQEAKAPSIKTVAKAEKKEEPSPLKVPPPPARPQQEDIDSELESLFATKPENKKKAAKEPKETKERQRDSKSPKDMHAPPPATATPPPTSRAAATPSPTVDKDLGVTDLPKVSKKKTGITLKSTKTGAVPSPSPPPPSATQAAVPSAIPTSSPVTSPSPSPTIGAIPAPSAAKQPAHEHPTVAIPPPTATVAPSPPKPATPATSTPAPAPAPVPVQKPAPAPSKIKFIVNKEQQQQQQPMAPPVPTPQPPRELPPQPQPQPQQLPPEASPPKLAHAPIPPPDAAVLQPKPQEQQLLQQQQPHPKLKSKISPQQQKDESGGNTVYLDEDDMKEFGDLFGLQEPESPLTPSPAKGPFGGPTVVTPGPAAGPIIDPAVLEAQRREERKKKKLEKKLKKEEKLAKKERREMKKLQKQQSMAMPPPQSPLQSQQQQLPLFAPPPSPQQLQQQQQFGSTAMYAPIHPAQQQQPPPQILRPIAKQATPIKFALKKPQQQPPASAAAVPRRPALLDGVFEAPRPVDKAAAPDGTLIVESEDNSYNLIKVRLLIGGGSGPESSPSSCRIRVAISENENFDSQAYGELQKWNRNVEQWWKKAKQQQLRMMEGMISSSALARRANAAKEFVDSLREPVVELQRHIRVPIPVYSTSPFISNDLFEKRNLSREQVQRLMDEQRRQRQHQQQQQQKPLIELTEGDKLCFLKVTNVLLDNTTMADHDDERNYVKRIFPYKLTSTTLCFFIERQQPEQQQQEQPVQQQQQQQQQQEHDVESIMQEAFDDLSDEDNMDEEPLYSSTKGKQVPKQRRRQHPPPLDLLDTVTSVLSIGMHTSDGLKHKVQALVRHVMDLVPLANSERLLFEHPHPGAVKALLDQCSFMWCGGGLEVTPDLSVSIISGGETSRAHGGGGGGAGPSSLVVTSSTSTVAGLHLGSANDFKYDYEAGVFVSGPYFGSVRTDSGGATQQCCIMRVISIENAMTQLRLCDDVDLLNNNNNSSSSSNTSTTTSQ